MVWRLGKWTSRTAAAGYHSGYWGKAKWWYEVIQGERARLALDADGVPDFVVGKTATIQDLFDEIRDQLAEMGVVIEDTPHGAVSK